MVKVLIDDCFPAGFSESMRKHFDIVNISDLNPDSIKDETILRKADEEGVQFWITSDKNLPFTQQLQNFKIAVAILYSENNLFPSLLEMESKIVDRISRSNGEKFFVIT
jgi:hypothetical protein